MRKSNLQNLITILPNVSSIFSLTLKSRFQTTLAESSLSMRQSHQAKFYWKIPLSFKSHKREKELIQTFLDIFYLTLRAASGFNPSNL